MSPVCAGTTSDGRGGTERVVGSPAVCDTRLRSICDPGGIAIENTAPLSGTAQKTQVADFRRNRVVSTTRASIAIRTIGAPVGRTRTAYAPGGAFTRTMTRRAPSTIVSRMYVAVGPATAARGYVFSEKWAPDNRSADVHDGGLFVV